MSLLTLLAFQKMQKKGNNSANHPFFRIIFCYFSPQTFYISDFVLWLLFAKFCG